MPSLFDEQFKNIISSGDCEIIARELPRYSRDVFTEFNLEMMCDFFNPLIINNNMDAIRIIVDYLYSLDINDLDVLLIKNIYIFCAIHNFQLLERMWTELNLVDRTYIMPHSAISGILQSCDSPEILVTVIRHMRETDSLNEEDCDIEEWILDTVLINGSYNCLIEIFRTLAPLIPVTGQNIYASIMGGNVDCFKLLFNNYGHIVRRYPCNKLFELAAGYGGLSILIHLMTLFELDPTIIDSMFAHALACGRKDTLIYIHDTLRCRNYTGALEYGRQFNDRRSIELENMMGYHYEYHEKEWYISHTYEEDYNSCVRIIHRWLS
jgi:hypothetical protein